MGIYYCGIDSAGFLDQLNPLPFQLNQRQEQFLHCSLLDCRSSPFGHSVKKLGKKVKEQKCEKIM